VLPALADAAEPADPADPLPAMETALAAEPESLRLASEYRQAVIRAGAYDRAIDFFGKLVARHPDGPNAWLNYGYAYVDKIPSAGAVSRVILANESLKRFTRAIELNQGWLALYTRGSSYLYWPKVFGKWPLAMADLEKAMDLVRKAPKRRVYARVYISLGDACWRTGQAERARAVWREGLALYPGEPLLEARLERDAAGAKALDEYLYDQLDSNKRVNTDLSPIWAAE
jgi:tetratricopeptide (TPR) repeat protein